VDARPSDAIALAVRIGAPIYATADVLDRAATSPDDEDEDDETGEGALSATALEETGEPIDAARLDIFREFVNSLDLDQEGRGGGPSSS
jgi:bifunctional DNase/RNase